ncbi:hypothetical protein AB2L28_17140 [Kineococcus sp. TBRC 1896]|uniref:Uncharacterized protein n=1 Tax=Kineococcus mangrovi TaxID=1660183 RepID=A0ABV4I8A1_9ACTN
MWWRWYTAPAWWRVLEFSVLFAAVYAVGAAVTGPDGTGFTLWTGLVAGLVVGLSLGTRTAAARRRLVRSLPPGTTPEQVRAAVRASRRGPVPHDPVVRVVATVLLRQRVAGALGTRRWSAVVGAVGTVVGVVLALTSEPGGWLLAAVFLHALVEAFWAPRRLAGRLVVVADD